MQAKLLLCLLIVQDIKVGSDYRTPRSSVIISPTLSLILNVYPHQTIDSLDRASHFWGVSNLSFNLIWVS